MTWNSLSDSVQGTNLRCVINNCFTFQPLTCKLMKKGGIPLDKGDTGLIVIVLRPVDFF